MLRGPVLSIFLERRAFLFSLLLLPIHLHGSLLINGRYSEFFFDSRRRLENLGLVNTRLVLLILGCLSVLPTHGGVVVNEIFYHAPADIPDLQWIELLNDSDRAVDLSGWRLTKGVQFNFATGSKIEPHGFLVLCKDQEAFKKYYSVSAGGAFKGSLKKGGESLELRDATDAVVDVAQYSDRPPWPRSPDGHTASLERICPSASGLRVENWMGSPLADDEITPGGTPGKANAAFAVSLPPVIDRVTFQPSKAKPGEPIQVQAHVPEPGTLKKIEVLYRVVQPGIQSEEVSLPMTPGATEGTYSATIPGQQVGGIVRFRVQATDSNSSARRLFPNPTELQPAFSCLVWTNLPVGRIPVGLIIHPDAMEVASADPVRGDNGGDFSPEGQGRFRMKMELDRQLDLAGLWTSLLLSNPPSGGDLEKLRSVFTGKLKEREAVEKSILASKDRKEGTKRIPETVAPFKTKLSEELSPLLSGEQKAVLEKWRTPAPTPAAGESERGNPEDMLRQFIRLEPSFLHLSLSSNLPASQIATVRSVFVTALQERQALLPLLQKMMSSDRNEQNQEGDDLESKAMAIEPSVDQKLKSLLTGPQFREFLTWRLGEMPPFLRKSVPKLPDPPSGNAAFVYFESATSEPKLFDFVTAPTRSGGWKVHFGKENPLHGMTSIDLILEASERWVLAEPLAYEFHRRASVPAPRTDFLRLWVDGRPAGYRLLIEQPNKSFLRHNNIRDDGNLYKANWTGRGLVGQNQKRTNLQGSSDDLVQVVDELEKSKNDPAAQWEVIRRQLNVEEVMNHYAVRLMISDWDGFFNNYYLYHDIHGTGKWSLFPWDEDKTWGDFDGPKDKNLHDLPLIYGSETDRPPGSKPGDPPPRGIDPSGWWRPGGYVSKPVLANPTFRRLLIARIRELLDSEFKEDRLFPSLESMQERLTEEVSLRAELLQQDPEKARQKLTTHIQSIKDFIKGRRAWLLEQEEIRNAGSVDRSLLPVSASNKKSKEGKKKSER